MDDMVPSLAKLSYSHVFNIFCDEVQIQICDLSFMERWQFVLEDLEVLTESYSMLPGGRNSFDTIRSTQEASNDTGCATSEIFRTHSHEMN